MTSSKGLLNQRTSTDYTIPTSKDTPNMESDLVCEPYYNGPFGAKAVGELTFIGAAPAYALAVENAIGKERSEEHTSELQSRQYLVCRLLLEKKKKKP